MEKKKMDLALEEHTGEIPWFPFGLMYIPD